MTKIFFDGGLRPVGMELAVVVGGRMHVAQRLGPGTSMEAEWRALIAAVRLAVDLGIEDAVLLGDAAAVIAQASGAARVPVAYRPLAETFRGMPKPCRVRLRHVRRAQNLAGIGLERWHAGRVMFPPLP
ncbi:reverse transcriptase-like protein [uncultured Sphingomonas sp.]|uniref:reverse transcriptase-like protein n=2 Tax=uncultured Sphingomonas sp. TaxID=158754 RepID=UPI0025DA21F5|nr:reverse transcriptase-like protein [uncultured Sphingomonas sp.]